MRAAGAFTLAQDEASCVVYGMPGEAVTRGGVAKIVPLGRIAGEIAVFAEKRTLAAKDMA
jgi:two-component system chemotaxis response regulator CheB